MAAYIEFFKFEVYLAIIVLLLFRAKDAAKTEPISNKRLCADKECNVVISRGRALASHLSSDPLILSFRKDDIINIKSKSAGSNPRLWGGECNGQRGYFDRNFVREIQVYVAHPQFLENTEPLQFKNIGRQPPAPVDKANRRDHFVDKANIAEDEPEDKPKFVRSDATRPKLDDEDEITGESIVSELEADTKDEVGSDSNNKSTQEEPTDLKEAPPESEAHHDDDEWDDLDYIQTDRDRFDTSAFNQFVKKSLGVEGEKTQEELEAKNVDATFHVSPQEAIFKESLKEDSSSPELSPEKPLVEPPIVKSSVQETEKPSLDIPTENSHVEPTQEREKLTVEATQEKLSAEPMKEKLSVEPTKEKNSVEHTQENLPNELTKERLSVNLPDTPLGSLVDKSKVEGMDKATVELPKISVEAAESQTVGDTLQDDQSVGVKRSSEKDAASHKHSSINLGDTLARDAVKENVQTEKVKVQQDEANIEDLTKTANQEKKTDRGRPSEDSGVKTFPIEDDEENDIGAEIPVFDPMSVVSSDNDQNKKQKPASVEPQTVELPTADYADISKVVVEKKVEEVKSKASVSGSEIKDIIAGQGEAMKVNIGIGDIIDGSSVANFDNVVPGDANSEVEALDANSDEVEALKANSDKVEALDANSDKVEALDANSDEVVAGDANSDEVEALNANSDKVMAGDANSDKVEALDANSVKVVAGNANSDKVEAMDANSNKVVAGSNTGTESYATKEGIDKSDDKVVAEESSVKEDGAVSEKEGATHELDKLPDAVESIISSEVRPDTPSGKTPEQGQSDDPVSAQEVKEKNDLNTERVIQDASGDKEEKLSPVDLNLFQRDENKVVSGGFEGFLQPSSRATHLSEETISTPSLNLAARIVESVGSLASANEIHHTKVTEDKQEMTGGQKIKPDPLAADKYETVVEAGSTIILDAEGNIVTAFMPDPTAQTQSAVVLERTSTADKPLVTPTGVVESTVSSTEIKQQAKGHMDVSLQSSIHAEASNISEPVHIDEHLLDSDISDVYKSSDFSSRKVLSVNNQPAEKYHDSHDHHHDSHDHHHDTHDHLHDTHDHLHDSHDHPHDSHNHHHGLHDHHDRHHSELPHKELPGGVSHSLLSPDLVKTQSEELSSVILDILDKKPEAPQEDKQTSKDHGQASDKQPAIEEMNREGSLQNTVETSTQPPGDYEIPPPPTRGDDQVPSDFDSGGSYHSRKINDGELPEEEEAKPSEFVLMSDSFIDTSAKFVFERLPTWMIRPLLLLEPLGLSPSMSLLVALFSIAVLVSACLASVCSSGNKKPKLRATLDVIGELEAKLQLAIKEKENLEDSVKDIKTENQTLKEEMSKQKKTSGKNEIEIHAVQHQNETLKKHVLELETELEELKKNSVTKQGEAKQTNKKTKELEKLIKKLEEKEKHVEQENHKLTLELRHKEEQLVLIEGKVSGFTEQIGHLQISKDQLLTEAEDWKEKVTDLKERLEQREEEFKQMQENIMFKDNELEVLKDCFLQLKSFEEEEAEVEDGDTASQRVQKKLSAMMDVSKVNASLRAIEEERNMLSNRLHIESEARKELEEQLENSRRSVESSMADKMKAERQCQEAQTKLNVLSSYFKEKEMQLQRELGEHEALKKQNLNKLVSADETTRTMQQEVEIFRTQVESLKRELASSERDFRSQIAANEKKAHENWLAARAAERELKEARHDAGVLRQKLTDLERRQFMGPGGLIRPLPTRGLPPPGMLNGPPPPAGMDRSPSRGSLPPLPPPHLRDEEFLRRGPPMGIRQPHPEARSPPLPPFGDARSPPPRMPPPGMLDGRSPPPYDRRPPPPHMLDRRSPPFRLPPPEMLSHPMRGGPLPPPHFARGGSPSSGADSPHLDRSDGRYPPPGGRYPPPYARNPPFPPDRPSPRGPAPRQQQSQV